MATQVLNPLDEAQYRDFIAAAIQNEFNKPIIENIFYINIDYLIENSILIDFKQKYEYSPQQVCIEIYGNKDYYPLILLVNKCSTIFQFNNKNYKKIIVPNQDAIINVINSNLG